MTTTSGIERRGIPAALAKIESREREGAAPRLEGYAAVFYDGADPGTEYWLWDDVVERIMPGAFARAAREDDVRALFNHDVNQLLGRRGAGTLTLAEDARGLRYAVVLADTQAARDVATHVRRGDVVGSSVAMRPLRVSWIEQSGAGGQTVWVRNIEEVELFDVGPVTYPAYTSTTATDPAGRSGSPIRRAGDEVDLAAVRAALNAHRAAAAASSAQIAARLRRLRADEVR